MSRWHKMVENKIIDPTKLALLVEKIRSEGKTIATLNGSFDLLHPGHLYMISEAAECATILIMLLNSDRSIASYKGPDRPYCSLQQRLMMIAALSNVTYVSWFDEITPCATLEIIRPDVHVNGIEYGPNCIEASVVKKHGGRIHLVERIGDFSTTKVIQKICV